MPVEKQIAGLLFSNIGILFSDIYSGLIRVTCAMDIQDDIPLRHRGQMCGAFAREFLIRFRCGKFLPRGIKNESDKTGAIDAG